MLSSLSSTCILSLGVVMSLIIRWYAYKLGIETGSLIQKQRLRYPGFHIGVEVNISYWYWVGCKGNTIKCAIPSN